MSFVSKVRNWTSSSISDDKNEIETYQVFQNEINNIKQTIEIGRAHV